MSKRAHTLFTDFGSMEPGIERAYVFIDTSAGGAITTATSRSVCAITVVKTAGETGRYTFTFDGGFKRFLAGGAIVQVADDAAITAASATAAVVRAPVASTGIVYLQMYRTDTLADAEVLDGANIYAWVDIQLSSARG